MIKTFKDRIQDRKKRLTEMRMMTEEKLSSYPEGRISIKHRNSDTYYYLSASELVQPEKLLNKDDHELVEKLLQRSYLEKILKAIKDELKTIELISRKYPECVAEEIYYHLSEERKQWVKPIIPTDEQFVTEWQNMPYTPKPFKKGAPYFETLRGERVRSKSEVIIADRLYTSGIPYKYECPLIVGNEVFHPDFTILRVSDRKILYLEHNGKVGNLEYGDDMVDRINKYSLAGILQNDKLYFTFESANRPLDVRTLDKMINEVFR